VDEGDRGSARSLLAEPGAGVRLLVLGAAFAMLALTRGPVTALLVLGVGLAASAGAGYLLWRRRARR
jgi:hypothetical protein